MIAQQQTTKNTVSKFLTIPNAATVKTLVLIKVIHFPDMKCFFDSALKELH